ncbi:MAG TPA: aldo/keto reductase [Rhodospirillales bacterium]|nr:aldo/keto reductase [Rhodospirillales bacterium]
MEPSAEFLHAHRYRGTTMKLIESKGARIPALGFGTARLDDETCTRAIAQALEAGYRHIDTAQGYGNEAAVGRAVAESGLDRAEIFLTTKISRANLAARDFRDSVARSLDALQIEQVDLFLAHWPVAETPLSVVLEALAEIRSAGRARLIGVSNYTVNQLREAVETFGADLLTNQVEYHPFLDQRRLLDFARSQGMTLTAYCPLAKGTAARDATLRRIAAKHGKTAAQVTLRWLIEQDGVIAIPQSTDPARAAENLRVFDFALDAQDHAAIAGLAGGRRLVDPAWSPDWDSG